MRRALLLVVFLCGFCVSGFADTDKLSRQSDERFSAAVSRFENARNNYFSSLSPGMVRADIARRQQKKRTRDLLTAAVVAGSFLLLVGLGVLVEKFLKKHHVLSRVRLSSKKRHGTHTLDDVFEIEKRG